MLRSLYSGISGMKNFQTKLDVIGNNIANVNTVGFKKSRVTFKDMISQTVAGGSNVTNSKQIGLGAATSSIDVVHSTGAPQATQNKTDLAIDGDGYFQINTGAGIVYTRAGNFERTIKGTLLRLTGTILKKSAAAKSIFRLMRKITASVQTEPLHTLMQGMRFMMPDKSVWSRSLTAPVWKNRRQPLQRIIKFRSCERSHHSGRKRNG